MTNVGDDPLTRAHEQLTQAVADLASSEAWLQMLRVAAAFTKYSPSNVLLIATQRPNATQLGGIRLWNSLGRRVVKGEKGIAILAPCLYKSKGVEGVSDPDRQQALRGFRVVHVFDVSQTEGEPLPDVSPTLLTGPAPQHLWDSLAEVAANDGYTLQRGDCGGANGFTSFDERVIRIRDDVEPAQAAKTLAHEVGHVRAEHEPRFADQYWRSRGCRGVAEVEAESIAYLVAAAAGMDASNYSVPYVASWAGGDVVLLKTTMTRVLAVARDITHAVGLAPQGNVYGAQREPALTRTSVSPELVLEVPSIG